MENKTMKQKFKKGDKVTVDGIIKLIDRVEPCYLVFFGNSCERWMRTSSLELALAPPDSKDEIITRLDRLEEKMTSVEERIVALEKRAEEIFMDGGN